MSRTKFLNENIGFGYNPHIFDNGMKANNTVYSDRLFQWDPNKHDKLCQKHFGNQGQHWASRDPKKIEDFLKEYNGQENLILCKIMEYKNASTTYPYWRFDYLIK